MANINVPRRTGNQNDNQLFQIGGAIIGGMYGGPGGAMAGAGLGSQLSNVLDNGKKEDIDPLESSMSRRKAKLDQTPLRQIRESIDSL